MPIVERVDGPDFGLHRRRLRRLRVSEALRLDVDVDEQQRSRDLLIEALLQAVPSDANEGEVQFATADDALLDLVVSMALAVFPERDSDALSVILACGQVLAKDGQFARLQQLAGRFQSIGQRLQLERPFLSAQLDAMGQVLKGRRSTALSRLRDVLGLRPNSKPVPVQRSQEALSDLLAATALFRWLSPSQNENGTVDFLGQARDAALAEGDGLLLANVEFLTAFVRSSVSANAVRVLGENAIEFTADPLRKWVQERVPATLFPAQITAIEHGVMASGNDLVALPTSSGKTLIAELKIAAMLHAHPGSRALYVAPYRLLSRQVERKLRGGLRPLGLTVSDLGSGFDAELDASALIPDVAILTPERLDGLMRLSASKQPGNAAATDLLQSLSLLVFDEMQLVSRPGRGCRFELLLTRLRSSYPQLDFLGLSAATHGADELADWIDAPAPVSGARRPTGTLELLWQVDGKLIQRSGRGTASKVAEIPRGKQAADDGARLGLRLDESYHPVLYVEPTRPLAEGTAKRLHKFGAAEAQAWRDRLNASDRLTVDQAAEEVRALLGASHHLADMLSMGIAYHHAGVPTHLLRLIENLAERRLVRFFVATTTVAEGADLPFRVAILPHLNFQGTSGRLERDLYLNIIGRAGRANVAVEGLVFILDSEKMKNVVRPSLWSDTQRDRVRSVLPSMSHVPANVGDYSTYRELQGQLLGWLAEGGGSLTSADGGKVATVDEQLREMLSRTLVARTGDREDLRNVHTLFSEALSELAREGLVKAASPYQLTPSGNMARMTGLSFVSALRLQAACSGTRGAWLAELSGISALDDESAEQMARLVLESEEVLHESVWLRRTATSPAAKLALTQEVAGGDRDWPYGEDEFETDVALLRGWLLGQDYSELSTIPKVYKAGLFGGTDPNSRASDAAEQIGRVAYPSSWAFGAVRQVSPAGAGFPLWLRSAFELGGRTETACRLMRVVGLTRTGANNLAGLLPDDWNNGIEVLGEMSKRDLDSARLTTLDVQRVADLRFDQS